MPAMLRPGLLVLACGMLGACAGPTGTVTGTDDCVSSYSPVMRADTAAGLRTEMLAYRHHGRVASLRTQRPGSDVGAGGQDVVRVIDLLDAQGRRQAQVDVWRTDAGGWRAGVWQQCID